MSYDGLLTLFMTLLHTHMCLFVMWNAVTPCPALTSIFFLTSTPSLLQTLMHCLLWFCPLASFIVSSPACSLPLTLRLFMDGSTSCSHLLLVAQTSMGDQAGGGYVPQGRQSAFTSTIEKTLVVRTGPGGGAPWLLTFRYYSSSHLGRIGRGCLSFFPHFCTALSTIWSLPRPKLNIAANEDLSITNANSTTALCADVSWRQGMLNNIGIFCEPQR